MELQEGALTVCEQQQCEEFTRIICLPPCVSNFLSLRGYLRAKRRQAVIGIITGISIAGVAAGVASLVVALAINNGFRQDLQDRLLGSTSNVNLIRVQDDGIRDWKPLLERLSRQPHVVAAAPAVFEQVLISRGPRARGAVLKGMIPSYERNVSTLLNSVKFGSAEALEETPSHGTGDAQTGQPGNGNTGDQSPSSSTASSNASLPCLPLFSVKGWRMILERRLVRLCW